MLIFLLVMIIPVLSAWTITTFCIQYKWLNAREAKSVNRLVNINPMALRLPTQLTQTSDMCLLYDDSNDKSKKATNPLHLDTGNFIGENDSLAMLSPASKEKHTKEVNSFPSKVASYIIASPFPFAMLTLMLLMIVLIFSNIMSIAGLVCCTAMVMVLFTVCGNQWAGKTIWISSESKRYEVTRNEQEAEENTNEFFENLFNR